MYYCTALSCLVTGADVEHTRLMYPLVQDAVKAGYFVPNRGSQFCSRPAMQLLAGVSGGVFRNRLMSEWLIYVLKHPRTDAIRYVGWTRDLKDRMARHLYRVRRGEQSHENNWIRQLLAAGLEPVPEIVERGNGDY